MTMEIANDPAHTCPVFHDWQTFTNTCLSNNAYAAGNRRETHATCIRKHFAPVIAVHVASGYAYVTMKTDLFQASNRIIAS